MSGDPRFLTAMFAPTQLIAWGAFYYALPVFVDPVATEFGWDRQLVFHGLAVALLTSVVMAPIIGHTIDRGRGRAVLVGGQLLGAACLLLLSRIDSLALFFILCCGLGASQAACLYDSAFSILHRQLGTAAPRAILHITLVAGFSGTLFVPGAQYLMEQLGWRPVAMILAAVALVPAALFLILLPAADAIAPLADDRDETEPISIAWTRDTALMTAAFAVSAAGFSVVTIHLLPILLDRGLGGLHAAQIFAIIGPAQIAGRVALWLMPGAFRALHHGRFAFLLQPAAILVLAAAGTATGWLLTFAILFGIGSGLQTIVRGTAPAELFDHRLIGRINGAIGAVSGMTRAVAPALFAFGAATLGVEISLLILFGFMLAGAAAFAGIRGKA